MTKSQPIGVTILTMLAGLGTIVAIIHTLQLLHVLPMFLGPVRLFTFNPLGAVLWAILAAIYIWLVRGLWNVDPRAWLFVVILSILNLALGLISVIGGSSLVAMAPAVLVNGLILMYCILPGTKRAFGAP